MKLLKIQDFECVAQLAVHCDQTKICIAENEALSFDLKPLFCGAWDDIIAIINEVLNYEQYLIICSSNPDCTETPLEPDNYEKKRILVYGGDYISLCGNKSLSFDGIIKMIVYYTYARYTVLNSFNDTPNGNVIKTNDFSIPKTLKELESFADKYRNMGHYTFEESANYLCTIPDIIYWDKCKPCSCGHRNCKSNPSTVNKGYGIKSRIISKQY